MKFAKIFNSKVLQKYFLFVFLLLLLINFLARLNLFFKINWFNDDSRDFLVTRNIILDHDFRWIVPFSAYADNVLKNSVFYYYFLTIFMFFSFAKPFLFRILFLIFFFSTLVIFSYLFSKLFFTNKKLQLLTVLFFLYFPSFYSRGSYTFQPNFAIPFLIACIYYFFYAYKKKSIKYLTIANLLYLISTQIHYAHLLLFPWVIATSCYLQYRFNQASKTTSKLKTMIVSQFNYPSLIILLNLGFIFLNQKMSMYANLEELSLTQLFDQLFFNKTDYLMTFYDNGKAFFQFLLGSNTPWNCFYLFALGLIFLLFFLKKKSFYSLNSFFALLSSSTLFLLVDKIGIETWYFYPILIFLLIFSISVLSTLSNKLASIILIFFLFIFFVILFPFTKNSFLAEKITKHEFVASIISSNIKANQEEQTDFLISTVNNSNNNENAAYWIFLEQALGRRLIKNDPQDNSYFLYSPVHDYSDKIYLICDDSSVEHDLLREDWCFAEFNLRDSIAGYKLLYASDEENLAIYYLLMNEEIHKWDIY